MLKQTEIIKPQSFNAEDHWYPKAFNATIHPMVNFFLNLDKFRIIRRYSHLHPKVNQDKLREVLDYSCQFFQWSGADLINSTSADGKREMVVIENNSCPSGQKSMPLLDDHQEFGSYKILIENSFRQFIKPKPGKGKIDGHLAVIYDKNYMETSGYAATIADVFNEDVLLVPYLNGQPNKHIKIQDGIIHVKVKGRWKIIRAAFKYLTQRPWNRIPIQTKTKIFNPIIACLAGGRNKMVAAKAYDLFNAELVPFGLKVNMPETIWDISKDEIPLWVQKMGGHAVIKIPYSNAGQGVYTITSQNELDNFMAKDFDYQRFIVQSLIGNYQWSSRSEKGKYYHVGTIPNIKGQTFVNDVRMMVMNTNQGIKPICIYSRRSEKPLTEKLRKGMSSWEMLGTNLSIKLGDNEWTTDTRRLILMDRRDFNRLGIGLDDLIEAYVQTVLSTIAIDKMCKNLINSKGKFRTKLFKSLNNDLTLLDEIMI